MKGLKPALAVFIPIRQVIGFYVFARHKFSVEILPNSNYRAFKNFIAGKKHVNFSLIRHIHPDIPWNWLPKPIVLPTY
ncbi:hypothetical protein [Aequorivita todarodis]|uniref:hypothetical protein n=1 Tax=Aequorivita todarodis TaxID=2036821 RepID=UPI00235083A6|nr:hypothetical protein [Aequorivita todarodis]